MSHKILQKSELSFSTANGDTDVAFFSQTGSLCNPSVSLDPFSKSRFLVWSTEFLAAVDMFRIHLELFLSDLRQYMWVLYIYIYNYI